MLALRQRKIKATDILDLLIQRVRKPSGKDVWHHDCPEVAGAMEREEMVVLGWKEGMSRQETLPIQNSARAQAFRQLPADDQKKWCEKASKWKPTEPTQ